MQKSASFDDHKAVQAALTMPEGIAGFLLPEPMSLKHEYAPPEWLERKGVVDVEMAGLVKNMMWDQVPRPTNNKLLSGPRCCKSERKTREVRWKSTSTDSWSKDSNRCLVYTSS